jgi:hypothetical protein
MLAVKRTPLMLVLGLALIAPAAGAEARWRPAPTSEPWQWQLSGRVDLSVPAPVYDVDGLRASARLVRALHRRGRRAICYVSVGSHEPYRGDARRFPDEVIGRPLEGFPDERWLDIRRIDLLAPVLRTRFDECARKGFDGVEPDNMDGYANRSGFPLTARDQLRFNRWVAREVRRRGMAVGLKNDAAQVPRLVRSFDFAVVEQCFQFRECGRYSPFVKAGKAVFAAEYETAPADFCAAAGRLRFSVIFKRLELGPFRRACP